MNKHILLVEDDFYLGRLYRRILKQGGYSVTLVENGNDGLWALIGQRPDLILLDILMPGIGGIEVLEKIKADSKTKDIPVVLLTNLEQDDLMERAMKMGASGYWIKVVMMPQHLVKYIQNLFQDPSAFHDPKTIIFPKSFYSTKTE